MKKKTYKFESIGKFFEKKFSFFFIETNVYKSIQYKQFRCNVEEKMDKQKWL